MNDQVRAALAKANVVRLGHAAVKREVAAGTLSIRDAFADERASGIIAADLLIAQRRWGTRRALRTLKEAGITDELRRVRDLTPRQIRRLLGEPEPERAAPAPPPPAAPVVIDTEAAIRRRAVALIAGVLIGKGGRTATEIGVLLREAGHASEVTDLDAVLEAMRVSGVVWRDESLGFALFGVDTRYYTQYSGEDAAL